MAGKVRMLRSDAESESGKRIQARGLVDEWNESYRPGDLIEVTVGKEVRPTCTDSFAFVQYGEPVIWARGIAGTVHLTRVAPDRNAIPLAVQEAMAAEEAEREANKQLGPWKNSRGKPIKKGKRGKRKKNV